MKEYIKKHPIFSSVLFSGAAGLLLGSLWWMADGPVNDLYAYLLIGLGIGALLIYPAVLTLVNIATLFWKPKEIRWHKTLKWFEYITIILGILYSCIYAMVLTEIKFEAEWDKVLINWEVHQPIWTEGAVSVILLFVIGLLGYLVLSFWKLEKLPPLAAVLAMAAMYLGVTECIVWCIQISEKMDYILLMLFPANCIVITAKTVRYKIYEWNQQKGTETYQDETILNGMQKLLHKAEYWPLLALLLTLPLLGVVLGVLNLFGQKPDALIKAWTETAEWRLSAQTAPPNLQVDQHYLCTVAAGGHEKIVKPIRMGERHGHRVVVNRQLCIANAFEQILEERTPRFHRAVRHFYDTYGFPIAKLIRTKGAADVVYILMKPLEWVFLAVLYLCDTKPENRIVTQYLPKKGKRQP